MAEINERLEGSEKLTADEEFEAVRLVAEGYSDTAPMATRYRDITPTPTQGTAVPVAQPGRPPMSQWATDHATLVIVYSFSTLPVSAAMSLGMWASSLANPTTVAIAAAAPCALGLSVGFAARLIGRGARDVVEALPHNTVHHHHHTGPTVVQHTQLHSHTHGLSKTINHQQLPDGRQ